MDIINVGTIIGIVVLSFTIYYLFGIMSMFFLKLTSVDCIEIVVMGYFVYQLCFFLVALPSILLKQSLSCISIIWCVLVIGICAITIYLKYKDINTMCINICKSIQAHKMGWTVILFILLLQCWFVANNAENCADFSYYIGFVSTSVKTNTILQYDAYTGLKLKTLNLKRLFSTAHVDNAVWSQVFDINALVFMKKIEGIKVILLANLIYVIWAKKMRNITFDKIVCTVFVIMIINIGWYSYFTNSGFLLFRTFESKSNCANFLIPAIGYGVYMVIKNIHSNKAWLYLFIVVTSSALVSPSAMVLGPVLVALVLGGYVLCNKNIVNNILRLVVCMLPCLIMFLFYIIQEKFGINIYI